jgi:hypothetical protein
MKNRSHHLHLPAVNLQVGRQGTFANAWVFGHERAVSLGWAAVPRGGSEERGVKEREA